MIKEMYQEYEHKMKKTVEVVISDFGGVRAGRANASVLEIGRASCRERV